MFSSQINSLIRPKKIFQLPNRTTITANRAIGSVVARNIAIAMEADEDEINSEPFSAVEYNLLFENAM